MRSNAIQGDLLPDTLQRIGQMCAERYILDSEANHEEVLDRKFRREMLRLKTAGWKTTEARTIGRRAVAGVLAAGLLMAGTMRVQAQDSAPAASAPTAPQAPSAATISKKIGPAAPVTYANRWELYGGINYMNFQAGQAIPNRMNMAGAEFLGTYWWTKKLGVGLDYRGEAGTTPVFPAANQSPYFIVLPLVYMNMAMLGAQYRGPKNQYAAVNYHAYFGASNGQFNATQKQDQPSFGPYGFYTQTGLYTNRTKPIAAIGGSLDINQSKKIAIRVTPDLMLEHFGTETREFFAIGLGVVYRFGEK
jgi:hypothetical protein